MWRAGRLFCLLLAWAAVASAEPPAPDGAQPASAVPGYIDDRTCASCHRDIVRDFPTIGMARAFYRPAEGAVIEDFENAHFYHEASQRHYEMVREDGRLLLRRYQLDHRGERRNVLEEEVDWILGSGSKTRSYLYQTEWGELYQLPLGWYSDEAKWAMAPGYDNADHQGFGRKIQRDCMFCHNAYPQVPAGSDVHGEPQVFPMELPAGLGCQRCHGPGEDHVQTAFDLDATPEMVQVTVVNPAKLSPQLRDDVCLQCHLQPSVTLSGVRQFDRPMYSYRPGEPLDEYLVHMDVVEERPREERFEINHHPYRLHQSPCFTESPAGALACVTCHDPHHKPPAAEARKVFREACLSCHTVDACTLEAMADDPAVQAVLPEGVAADDCAACHMSQRRTQDVVEVVLTDHLIRRRPGGPELREPFGDVEHRIETVRFLYPERAPEGPIAEVYRQVAMVRSGSRAALDRLHQALEKAKPPQVEPYLELTVGLLGAGRFSEAEGVLAEVFARRPDHVGAKVHLGVAKAAQGKTEAALDVLRRVVEVAPERPEGHFNLGRVLVHSGDIDGAMPHFRRALEVRPNLVEAWVELGNAQARLGQVAGALGSWRRALALDPKAQTAQRNVVEALVQLDRRDEALVELQAWLHLDPDNTYARQRLGRF